MSRDKVLFILTVTLAVGLVEVKKAAGWSDQTLMAVAFGVGLIPLVVWFVYELRGAPRSPRGH